MYQCINMIYNSVMFEGTFEECRNYADQYGMSKLLIDIRPKASKNSA